MAEFTGSGSVRLLSKVPEDSAEEKSCNDSEQETSHIVGWAPPVCPPLLPEACLNLHEEGL